LLIDTLNRTQRQAKAGHVSETTAAALKPLIDACSDEIKALQTVLDKNLPSPKSSSLQRGLLALSSLTHDKDVKRIMAKLENHIRLLTFHQSASNSDELLILRLSSQTNSTPPHQSRKPIFMMPFDPDDTFVGRQDVLDNVRQKLNASRRRAVLSGIGGVG